MIGFLCFVWVASAAFYQYGLVDTLSLDNILAPLMFLIAVVTNLGGGTQRGQHRSHELLAVVMLFVAVYTLSQLATRLSLPGGLVSVSYEMGKVAIYFLTPVLLMRRNDALRGFIWGMLALTVLVSFSNLAASLGWFEPPTPRLTVSRIGIDWLPRSVGLFVNYGDQALAAATATVLVLHFVPLRPRTLPLYLVLTASVLAALLSSQSRNVALTVALATFSYLGICSLRRARTPVAMMSFFLAAACILTAAGWVAVNPSILVTELSNWGGAQAAGTVADRFDQYSFALRALSGNWLTGVSGDYYASNTIAIELVHNLWLRELLRSGIAGTISLALFLVFMLLRSLTRAVRSRSVNEDAVALAILLSITLASQFYVAGGNFIWLVFGVAVGLATISGHSPVARAMPVSNVPTTRLPMRSRASTRATADR